MIISVKPEDYDQIFLGQDGQQMMSGVPDSFSRYFDWVLTSSHLLKKKEIPQTIYIKTDQLPYFAGVILPQIHSEFILITAGSDYSPEVNFPYQYQSLMENSELKYWYMNNMRTKTEKSFSLPAGLAAGKFWDNCTHKEVDEFLLKNIDSIKEKEKVTNKVFCSFRNRFHNDCGFDMVIRPAIFNLIKRSPELFDVFEPDSMNFTEYVATLGKYKYVLNPHGNGMDPNPTCWITLAMNSIPVIYRTPNTTDMFMGIDSIIFFDKFEQIIDRNLYVEKPPIDFEFLTCEYWANKIKSKI